MLAALLSTFLAVAAQAQTDTGSGTSSTAPTLTIGSSHVVAAAGEEVTFTLTASSAPSSALPVSVHVRAQGLSMDTRTVADVVLAAGATTVTLRLEQVAESIDESRVDVTLALAAGTGYSLGDASTARVSIYYPPATPPESRIESSPTPTPSASPPDAPSGVQVSATATDNYTVTWTAEAGETYRLEREAAYLFSYRVWQTVVDNLSVGSFTDDGLPCGLFYLFQVQAKVAGSAFGSGAAVVGSPQSCASTTSGGARAVRAAGTPVPRLRVVTDNPDPDRIQIRLLFFGPQGNEEQYTPTSGLDEFQADRSQRVPSGATAVWPNPESPGNSKYRREESSPEFFWTGLACGANYFFRARGNGDGSRYQDGWGPWTDDAHADPQHGSRSPVHGSTRGCTSLTPPKLTNLMMGSATETSIVARWGLPPLPLGLVNFNLRYRPEGVPDGWVDVLNNEGMTVLNGTEKVVMRLLCSAGYKFQIRAAGNGGIYSLDYGEWSDQVDGSTARCSKLGKPVVDVIPLPERWGELRWKGIRFADRYIVEVRKQPEGGKGWDMEGDWEMHKKGSYTKLTETSRIIYLDNIHNKGIADAPNAYQFRIMAVDDGTNAIPSSDYSDFVIVIDTPISAVNGHSPGSGSNDGRAMISQKEVGHDDFLGDNYAGGTYEYRYRRLANSGGHHTTFNWMPDNPVEVMTTSANPITGLHRNEIYAIQLIYTVTRGGKTARVFAARDAYVWPSNSPPDYGDRVATFPLNYSRNDMTYSYRICEGTFSSNVNEQKAWRDMIVHALDQWERALPQYVTMTLETNANGMSDDCADNEPVVMVIKDRIDAEYAASLSNPIETATIREFVEGLSIYTSFVQADNAVNEIMMVQVDDQSDVRVAAFHELGDLAGFADCVFNSVACAVPSPDSATEDILLNSAILGNIDPVTQPVATNRCLSDVNREILLYAVFVHEAGHVLGIGFGKEGEGQARHHPQIKDTVLGSGTSEFKCAPTLFDLMAIHALHQSRR